MEAAGSLYNLLQEKFHIIPSEADETLEVTLATKEEADLLQIEEGAPCCSANASCSRKIAVRWSCENPYRGDRYRYYVRLTR
jgi:GntR family transcriptional regulator